MPPQPAKLLKTLRATLGLDSRHPQVVYIQFAGYTRDNVNGLADSLAELGWNTQPTERIATASGLNEVRYGPEHPEDEAAARLLAADLSAAGHPGALARKVNAVKPGVLEIWTGSK
jgi:hypothetical protein